MDKIDARVGPEAVEDEAPPLDVWGVARTSLGDIFRAPRLDRRGIAALIGLVLVAWLSTSLYRVQPDEKGVVLRFGKWVATTDPGLHMHLPYPIETVLLPKVTQVNQVQLGVGPASSPRCRGSGPNAGRCSLSRCTRPTIRCATGSCR